MKHKFNCWEYHNCGLEPGGALAAIHGPCPVALAYSHDGENDGTAGGRVCWKMRHRVSDAAHTGRCSIVDCRTCRFRRRVIFEQEPIAEPALPAEVNPSDYRLNPLFT